ncbi:MAG: PLAT/LH2 domain-containing protein [Bacteroidota bacterium]
MAENQHRICHYTRGQIGWAHLFLELWTADVTWAGTDDDVSLDIGDRTYVIDTPDVDDFEKGSRIGYAIWDPGLTRADIKRVLIRKSPDGFSGGWKLKRVRLFFGGEVICDQSPDQWLEDDFRVWAGCSFNGDIVNSLTVRVTTGDVLWAGTDDDVSISMAGRTWNLDTPSDDFERGDTNTFRLDPGTSLYRPGFQSINIHKSPDGVAGGWRLKGVSVEVNGVVIYDNQSINKWMENNDRDWNDSDMI